MYTYFLSSSSIIAFLGIVITPDSSSMLTSTSADTPALNLPSPLSTSISTLYNDDELSTVVGTVLTVPVVSSSPIITLTSFPTANLSKSLAVIFKSTCNILGLDITNAAPC